MGQEINQGGETLQPEIRFKSEERTPQGFFSIVLELQPSKILMEFYAPRIVVGRSNGSDFRLPSLCVSRRHCMLNWSEQGWVLRDLDSRNGTYVNGNPIKAIRIEELDEIKIGVFSFVVKKAEAEFQLFKAIQEYKRAG
jgi:predicted component of type VI protein secretion system